MTRFLLFLSLALISAGAISGQTGSLSQDVDQKGLLTGTVRDINGSVVAGGHVVAQNSAVILDVAGGERPCKQKTMIEQYPGKPQPKIRKPEVFRSIAE